MATPSPTPGACIEESVRLKDAGNAALKAGDPATALRLYTSAFSAIHIVVAGRRREIWANAFFETYLADGAFKGQYGGILRLTQRIRLVANTIMAYLKLGDHAEAHFWGMRSINLMRDSFGEAADEPRPEFVAANEWGKIYFRTALAAKELGDVEEARALLRIAAAWLPEDTVVRAAKAEWGSLRIG